MKYDLIGKKFGRLLVYSLDKNNETKNSKWICSCECGNAVSVYRPSLISGKTQSCGCICSPPTEIYEKERIKRFFDFIDKTESCWIWTGSKDKEGYGIFSLRTNKVKAHRFSFELINGKIPSGYLMCHTCDNPSCVNPTHLYMGTPQQNAQDCGDRKRWGNKSKRLEEKKIEACKILLKSKMTKREISEVLQISLNTVTYYENR